jgi:BirA family biotin operon repressor/biotin-[acetyl-CoA-carboxylase] ligase
VARALHAVGVGAARLKWPNDLVVDGAKLGGILVETRNGGHAVIGIGLNHRRTPGLEAKVRRKLAFIDELAPVSRNRVIQAVGVALLDALESFEAQGLDALRADWEAMDAHAGQRLRVRLADGRTLSGVAVGLGEDGSLRIHTKRGVRAVTSGRVVSARAA